MVVLAVSVGRWSVSLVWDVARQGVTGWEKVLVVSSSRGFLGNPSSAVGIGHQSG